MKKGPALAVLGCVASAAMSGVIALALRRAPQTSGEAIGAVRVLANAACAAALAPRGTARALGDALRLRGDRWLWLWGLLGAATVTTMFAAIPLIGVGQTALLASTSGAFTAALAPLVLRERVRRRVFAAVAASLAGVVLLRPPAAPSAAAPLGWALGLASGLAAGLAYLALAKVRGRHPATTAMAYWSVACLAAYAAQFALKAPALPPDAAGYALLALAGACAALAQLSTANAYFHAPAAVVAGLGYLAPVLTLTLDVAAFGAALSARQAAGAALVVAAGLTASRSPPPAARRSPRSALPPRSSCRKSTARRPSTP